MAETHLALAQRTAPPSSPNLSPSKCFDTISHAQELVQAVKNMQMASARAKCTCSHTPPEDASEATSTYCSPTFPRSQLSPQIVTTEHVQQFLDILKSLSPKQEHPPPPATADKVEPEELPARASKLQFKTVNEVFVFRGIKV